MVRAVAGLVERCMYYTAAALVVRRSDDPKSQPPSHLANMCVPSLLPNFARRQSTLRTATAFDSAALLIVGYGTQEALKKIVSWPPASASSLTICGGITVDSTTQYVYFNRGELCSLSQELVVRLVMVSARTTLTLRWLRTCSAITSRVDWVHRLALGTRGTGCNGSSTQHISTYFRPNWASQAVVPGLH